nr:hypothetical protein [Tanacetum cinerariifolium]
MSDFEHSLVTYTSVPSPVEDYSDIGSPEVDGPPSPDYVPGPEEPEQAPLSLDYVSGPEEPEQAPPSPPRSSRWPIAATPTADLPGYIPEFDLKGDPEEDDEEDPKEDPADYPADSTVVALPAVDHVPSEEKRLRFASPTPSQEVGESLAAGAARQDEPAVARDDPYSLGITDTWDELVGAIKEIEPNTLQGVNQRVTDLSTAVEQETTIMYGIMEDYQDDRSQLRGRVNLLYRDMPVHRRLAVMIEREARMAREAWGLSINDNDNARSDVMSLRTTLVKDKQEKEKIGTKPGSMETPGDEPEQAPPSPVYLPYVPEPVHPEYMPPEDDVFPVEEQPLLIEEEQGAKAQNSKIPICYDNDEDYNSAITPNEPVDSLSMGDEHLDTVSGENGCDLPACFTTFLNVLFDADYKFDSVDDQSLHNEDVTEKIFSNPLFEEIISMKIDQHHFNAESDLVESMLNRDSSIISSTSKIDSLLDEFTGENSFYREIVV